MSRNVLVIGSGGREHALVRKLAQSSPEPVIYAAPGNPGTEVHAINVDLDPSDPAAVVVFCQAKEINLVIIGPEDPLIAGLADHLHKAGIPVFGPGAQGARLEGDKEFAKEVLSSAGVATPHYHAYSSSEAALKHLDQMDLPVVIKACGAAQGKGVAVCSTRGEAEAFVAECLDDQRFDSSRSRHPRARRSQDTLRFHRIKDGAGRPCPGEPQEFQRLDSARSAEQNLCTLRNPEL